jgi:flagellar protein FliS
MATRLSKAYLLTQVLTANKQEIVVYLYESAIGHIHRALAALRESRRAEAAKAIDRVVTILIELSGSLNYRQGGRLALRLDSIYNYLIETLTLANSRGDVEALEACDGILVILHDAWQQAATMQQPERAAERAQLRVSA